MKKPDSGKAKMERFKSITSSDVVHAVLKLRNKWKDRCIEEYQEHGFNDNLLWLCERKEAMTEGMYELMYELGCIPISELCELNHRCCEVFDTENIVLSGKNMKGEKVEDE